ncbi:hypothetical protein KL928_000795 [Ogataea angusta]|uniref:Uncharacterized protein n=1 Tax=Pichia angusta TaxID=870730 RepID=A0AAN6I899_PICAN|nr:uncharacterized protein KL928_000795 [Ogataea angusta]KAG7822320.1 hypothetical protein KL928_000795 [Ogataea angusta]
MNAVMMVETRSAEFVPLRQGASATEYARATAGALVCVLAQLTQPPAGLPCFADEFRTAGVASYFRIADAEDLALRRLAATLAAVSFEDVEGLRQLSNDDAEYMLRYYARGMEHSESALDPQLRYDRYRELQLNTRVPNHREIYGAARKVLQQLALTPLARAQPAAGAREGFGGQLLLVGFYLMPMVVVGDDPEATQLDPSMERRMRNLSALRRRGPASRWPRSSSRPTAVCAWARTRTAGGSRRSSSASSSRWTRCSAGPTRRARRWSARSRTASSRRRSTASTTAGPTSTSASPRRPASTATSASTCWPRPPPPGARAPRS